MNELYDKFYSTLGPLPGKTFDQFEDLILVLKKEAENLGLQFNKTFDWKSCQAAVNCRSTFASAFGFIQVGSNYWSDPSVDLNPNLK